MEAAGQLLDEAGWVMGSDGVREKDGAPLTIRALYVTSNRELGTVDGTGHGGSGRNSASTCSCRESTRHSSTRIAFETRAWDVFLAALNLDVPSLALPFVSGAAATRRRQLLRRRQPRVRRPRRRGERAHRAEACEVWNAAEAELYAQMNILPVAATTAPTSATVLSSRSGVSGIIANSLRLVEA